MQKAPRPTQAAGRYWRGKPVAEAEAASSGSDSEEEQVDARGVKKTLTEAELAKREGFVIKNDFDLTVKEEETPETALKPQTTIKLESSEDETDSQASEDSSSEEESSEEEEVAKPLYKPVFVSKRHRDPTVVKKLTQDEEELAEIERQAQLEQQRQQAHLMVGETIKRQIASKAVEDNFPDVDDRDGLDPQSEFEAWKLRELQRIKRDADARYAREKEREEIEQRRALPEDVRLKEDLEHAQKTREGKPKQQHAFLQKYHHKGVFYTEEEILQRDYSGQVEDQVVDVKSLPSIMQVRDYGKRSRSKHTHLLDVDTSKADAGWGPKALGRKFGDAGFASTSGGSRACFNCGQDGHVSKDCPMPRKDRPEASGSSSRACYNCGKDGHVSKDCPEPRKPRPNHGDGRREQDDGYRRRADWGAHKDVRPDARQRPSRSRSRSPRGERDSRRPRSRSPSPGRDRDRDRDKRRRYD